MSNIKKIEFSDITLKDWYAIQDILSIEDEYTTFNLLDYLYGIDSSNMTLAEVSKYSGTLSFLNNLEKYKDIQLEDKYTINGTTYTGFLDLTKVTVAQFIDYQNYIKETPVKFEKVLSVFIIPEGHTYNDGYDLQQAQQDMLELPFVVVQKVAFFLAKQLQTFVSLFLCYLKGDMKKMKGIDKKKKKLLIDNLDKTNLLLSELSHLS